MNFWKLRSTNQIANQGLQPLKETQVEASYVSKAAITLEGLIAEEPFQESTSSEIHDVESDKFGHENDSTAVSSGKNNSQADNQIDVTKDKGFLIIPYKEIPANWTEAPDILSFQSLDRSFVFPGEQIQILACLFAYKHDTEIITPFKVAAVLNKDGIRKNPMKQDGCIAGEANPDSQTAGTGSVSQDDQHGNIVNKAKIDSHKTVSSGECLLRMEDLERQTEALLQRFKNSHFFARIAESNEPLWSKRRVQQTNLGTSATFEEKLARKPSEPMANTKQKNAISAAIDRGIFDNRTSGGVARGSVECCSLANGDIVVLLQVNVGVQFVGDLILEILQFEKYQERKLTLENQETPALNQDPSGELLKWLLPLDNSIPPPAHPLPPPGLSSSSIIRSTPTKPPTVSGSSSSHLFSFGNLRSYSMSSLPPNMTPPPAVRTPNAKPPISAPEGWNQFSFKKFMESGKSGSGGLISFRGVPLQPERFSVQCGLEGIYTPGRRWRKKIELIQPVEIHSFSVDCNTDDLLCVNVKNVSPANAPDVVVFVDAITVVFEEASKSAPPFFLPIACIESGNNFTLPNLALRRGEEHSFILKPATTFWKHPKGQSHIYLRPTHLPAGNAASSWDHSSITEGKHTVSHADQYSVIVTSRCNYTESRLFFKHPTSWRPHISRDLMISVASEMSWQTLGSEGTQLPVQVLTLQASNMTSDNLTLTVRAPASFTNPPSIAPLSNSLSSSLSPSAELAKRKNSNRGGAVSHGLSSVSVFQEQKEEDGSSSDSINQQTVPISDRVPDSDLGCTHLWLQSRALLGCIPSQSTATVKLEVLPLTDGIITLDSLQIEVKEKGVTYIPEQSLKIYATSSITTSRF